MRMKNYRYAITMKTPLGERRGELLLTSLKGMCFGSLSLLDAKHTVVGEIRNDGCGSLSGTIQTLLRKLPFTAQGYFIPDGLDMELNCGNRTYAISGTRKEE